MGGLKSQGPAYMNQCDGTSASGSGAQNQDVIIGHWGCNAGRGLPDRVDRFLTVPDLANGFYRFKPTCSPPPKKKKVSGIIYFEK